MLISETWYNFPHDLYKDGDVLIRGCLQTNLPCNIVVPLLKVRWTGDAGVELVLGQEG